MKSPVEAPRSEGGRIKIIADYHADRRLLARTVIVLDNFNCTYILSWGEVRGLRGLHGQGTTEIFFNGVPNMTAHEDATRQLGRSPGQT